jgi:hypothetical protein
MVFEKTEMRMILSGTGCANKSCLAFSFFPEKNMWHVQEKTTLKTKWICDFLKK